MTNKEKRTALLTHGTTFTVANNSFVKEYVFEMYKYTERMDHHDAPGSNMSISRSHMLDSMNVDSIGTRKMMLYTFTLMGTRIMEVIRFDDVTILRVGEE